MTSVHGRKSGLVPTRSTFLKLEEQVFRAMNATRKKPLQCAPYYDQIRYTKYDPDCSWTKDSESLPRIPSTPNYKTKSIATNTARLHGVASVSEEDFDELCSLITQIGFVYITKHKKKET